MRRKGLTTHILTGDHLQVLEIMVSNVGRKIVDLDGTEQEAQREYGRTLHHGRVTAESTLCVHYQQRHLVYNVSLYFTPPGREIFPFQPATPSVYIYISLFTIHGRSKMIIILIIK